jgi:hypothetical protein
MYRNYQDPIDVFAHGLRFDAEGHLTAGPRRMAAGDGDWQLGTFHVETDADVHADQWEVHPAGEELVWCLRGGLRVLFRATGPGAADEAVRLRTGEGVIVPRSTWHRLELDEPSDVTSIVRRGGTRLEPVTTGIRMEAS